MRPGRRWQALCGGGDQIFVLSTPAKGGTDEFAAQAPLRTRRSSSTSSPHGSTGVAGLPTRNDVEAVDKDSSSSMLPELWRFPVPLEMAGWGKNKAAAAAKSIGVAGRNTPTDGIPLADDHGGQQIVALSQDL